MNADAKPMQPIIVIHGGTSGLELSEQEFAIREAVMKESLKAGQDILLKGGSAIDAVVAAIKVLEDHPEFNAGKGAVFTSDGLNELDASIMDGKTLNAGAIALARTIKNPIEAARIVMEKTPHTLIAGQGADELAKHYGLTIVDPKYFYTEKRYLQLQEAKKHNERLLDSDTTQAGSRHEPYLGTVGAIALDKNGNLAAATSTGGMTNKMTGRIGDTAIIGAGNYAHNETVAVSCTGIGDIYIRVAAAHEVSALYQYKNLSPTQAAAETMRQIIKLGGAGGIIVIDKNGTPGYAWSKDTLGMYHGQAQGDEEPKVFWPLK